MAAASKVAKERTWQPRKVGTAVKECDLEIGYAHSAQIIILRIRLCATSAGLHQVVVEVARAVVAKEDMAQNMGKAHHTEVDLVKAQRTAHMAVAVALQQDLTLQDLTQWQVHHQL